VNGASPDAILRQPPGRRGAAADISAALWETARGVKQDGVEAPLILQFGTGQPIEFRIREPGIRAMDKVGPAAIGLPRNDGPELDAVIATLQGAQF
jgi:hypothetical protein